jgi:hypothetical protein
LPRKTFPISPFLSHDVFCTLTKIKAFSTFIDTNILLVKKALFITTAISVHLSVYTFIYPLLASFRISKSIADRRSKLGSGNVFLFSVERMLQEKKQEGEEILRSIGWLMHCVRVKNSD